MSRRHICKNEFQVCYHCLDIYENPNGKIFLNPSVPSVLKIIEIKNYINFYYHTSFCYFPCYWGLRRQVLKLCFCQTYAISVSLTIEMYIKTEPKV